MIGFDDPGTPRYPQAGTGRDPGPWRPLLIILLMSWNLLPVWSVLAAPVVPAGRDAPVADPAAEVPEPGSAEAIAAATGDARFLSPWVASLPQSASVPSPLRFLGRIAGA